MSRSALVATFVLNTPYVVKDHFHSKFYLRVQIYFHFFLEIEDFLSEEECDDIIFMAKTQGLERSKTLGEKVPEGEELSPNRTAERNVPENPEETFQNLDLNADGSIDVAEVSDRCMLTKYSSTTEKVSIDVESNLGLI